MKHVVWLTEWLPTEMERYSGDGIERRAKAASLYNDITIVYVKKRLGSRRSNVAPEVRVYNEHCRAIIYFYPSIADKNRLLDKLLSNYYFLRLHCKGLRHARQQFGRPAGIQVNVTMKDGFFALLYKWFTGTKYIVVEGWSLFLPEARPTFADKSALFRVLTKRVLKGANLLVTVSAHLADQMKRNVLDIPSCVVPSVVDDRIFFPGPAAIPTIVFRFIHISSLDYPKNFEQIAAAVKIVKDRLYKIELIVHGPDRKEIKQLVAELQLEAHIHFKQENEQEVLAETLRSGHALILYSRYETFGNVLIEANACGLPVIVSNYPTFREIVTDRETGLVANGNDAASLAEQMIAMIDNYAMFDGQYIANKTRSKYGFDVIGKRFNEIYEAIF